MANIRIPKRQFEKDVGKLDEKMQNKIALFGTNLEKMDENELELEIFPDRPDLLSYQGFKRSFLAFLGKKVGLKEYRINKPEKNYSVKIESSVKEIRPHTMCAIIKDLRFDENKIKEIIEIQEKLHTTIGRKRKKVAIGIYPLEKISLPITYKALEPDKIKFIPLESEKIMSGLEILQKHPSGKEYSHLLKGKAKFPIFIDDKNQILSMPPIINSELTGRITEKTRNVFVECSGFDLYSLEKCLNIITTTLAEMGGKIYQMKLNLGEIKQTPTLKSEKRKISLENTNKLLGLELNEKQLKQFLEKMGHNYNAKTKEVEIGSWRTDILHEVDLIEDVAIAYGYENFVPEIPEISTIGQEDQKEMIKKKIAEILIGLKMVEISNYHLTNKKDQFTKMGINEKTEENILEVLDSKTEYNVLRKNLSPYILKTFSRNIDSEYPQKIFEIGKVFQLKSDKIKEIEKLSIGLCSGNFTEIKQILEYLERMLNIKLELKQSEKNPPHLIDGRTGKIMFKDKEIGEIGEVHPKILRNWKIKMPVSILEIDLEEIFKEFI